MGAQRTSFLLNFSFICFICVLFVVIFICFLLWFHVRLMMCWLQGTRGGFTFCRPTPVRGFCFVFQAILGKHVGWIIINKSQSVPFDPPKPPLENKKGCFDLVWVYTFSEGSTHDVFFFPSVLSAIIYVAKTRTWKMKWWHPLNEEHILGAARINSRFRYFEGVCNVSEERNRWSYWFLKIPQAVYKVHKRRGPPTLFPGLRL